MVGAARATLDPLTPGRPGPHNGAVKPAVALLARLPALALLAGGAAAHAERHLAPLPLPVEHSGPSVAGDPPETGTPGENGAAGRKADRQGVPSTTLEERRTARLDALFDRLSRASNERRADRIARHIMRRLSQSGSPTVDLLMTRATLAMQARELTKALDLLDGVVRLAPDFAEGWNRRATVHFMTGDFGRSMADIEQVLRLEPRHWGALAGLSMMLVALDRKTDAVAVMDEALAIHPYLDDMRERRDRLVLEVTGSDI